MPADGRKRAHPLLWVPSLYFAMGIPNIAVSVVAAIMYKNLGLSNAQIAAYTGTMYLPWVLKPLWAPVLELYRSKRFYVLSMELVMVVTFAAVALAVKMPNFVALTLALFWVSGFASATQDIAGDGVYITSTTEKEQGVYMGVQGMCWNLGRILVSGALVSLTQALYSWVNPSGVVSSQVPDPAWQTAWTIVMGVIAAILFGSYLWHLYVLPPGARAADAPTTAKEVLSSALDTWSSFFRKPRIWMMIAVVYFYRFGEGFIEKIGPLFLMEKRSLGGLGLDNMALGGINGIAGTAAYIGGTLLGGVLASKYGLKRIYLLLAFGLNVPHITFFYLSHALPTNIPWITCVVLVEKFGYGLGTVGMMLYMMQELSPGKYRTAHYAFATGVMALCMMSTGTISGQIQEWLGYRDFFLFVLFASVPPVIFAALAPFSDRAKDSSADGV